MRVRVSNCLSSGQFGHSSQHSKLRVRHLLLARDHRYCICCHYLQLYIFSSTSIKKLDCCILKHIIISTSSSAHSHVQNRTNAHRHTDSKNVGKYSSLDIPSRGVVALSSCHETLLPLSRTSSVTPLSRQLVKMIIVACIHSVSVVLLNIILTALTVSWEINNRQNDQKPTAR